MSAKERLRNLWQGGLEAIKEGIESQRWPERPQSINLEVTSICDSKCIHCPRHEMDRPMRPMPLELFRKIVDEAAELGVPEICPNGFGEIMTMKSIDEHLAYLDSKPHKFRVIINTNGFRMTEDKIESLVRHKVQLLNICIDGATAKTAEAIRVNLKLADIEHNIRALMRIRRERGLKFPQVRVGMVLIPQNLHEVDAFIAKWRDEVDFLGIDGYSNRAGSLNEKFAVPAAAAPASACVLPFRELNIWADGRAVLCCNDWNEEYVVGDMNRESLKEIWHGKALRLARDAHARRRGNDLEICRKCNYWKNPKQFTRLWT